MARQTTQGCVLNSEQISRRRTHGAARGAWLLALTLVVLVALARAVQLAVTTHAPAASFQPALPLTRVSAVEQSEEPPAASSEIDAELKQLYAMCPESAAIGWDAVVASPEAAAGLLPPVREMADRVPTVKYPFAVRVAERGDANGQAAASEGEWLVDPNEWLGESASNAPALVTPSKKPETTEPAATEPNVETTFPSQSPGEQSGPTLPDQPSPNEITPVESPSEPWAPPAPITEPPVSEVLSLPPANEPPATKPLFPPPPHQGGEAIAPASTHPSSNPTVAPTTDAAAKAPAGSTVAGSPVSGGSVPGGTVDPHLELFAKNAYPSARDCATCHEEIYNDWSISAHAYANVSPMFQKFEQKLNDVSKGTVGYFCMRCHAPIATAMCISRDEPIWNLPEVAREGVTCIVCHRVKYMYGRSNGERHIEMGPIFAPVYGGIGGEGVAEVIHKKDHFKVKTSPDEKGPGQNIHLEGIFFEQLTRSDFCASCHQVAVYPGIKLEVVWEQYRASPACKKGIQCQDCHMGRVPGLPSGYDCGPVAKIGDKTVNDHRKKSNHVFYGPNYPIAHPGVFPFHLKANRWTIQEWLSFDWRGGWGTDGFEDAVADGKITCAFPKVWAEADDRYDAREIIDENLKKINRKRDIRLEIMENGSRVEGPFFDTEPCRGRDLEFNFLITNTNEGHNLLTASLGAQPQYWANVVVIGPDGQRVWETGYTDSLGDLANIHSEDVRHKRMAFDWQLMNLQTMFLITGAKGTDREFYVPVNVDIDQLPFIRPGVQPISVINHPPFIRMESQSLAPLGSRRVPYKVPGELLQQPGKYRISFRMRSRAEPPYFMRFCNATPDMLRSMNEWMIDTHPLSVEFYVR